MFSMNLFAFTSGEHRWHVANGERTQKSKVPDIQHLLCITNAHSVGASPKSIALIL